MANRPRVLIELVIAAALSRLVAKEVDHLVLVRRQELQAEGLVPPARRAVDANLPADREAEVAGRARAVLGHQLGEHALAQPIRAVGRVKGRALGLAQRGRSTDDADVARALPPLEKGAAVGEASALSGGLLEEALGLARHAFEQLVEPVLKRLPISRAT